MSTIQPELLPAEAPAQAPEKTTPRLTTRQIARRARTTAIATTAEPPDQWLAMLERLATNPDVDLTKIEKLIDLKERTARTEAEAQFNAAYAVMQGELPVVLERGVAERGEKGGSYIYARFEDIISVCRPIMAKHGFGIRFEHTVEGATQVCTGILSHSAGHSIRDQFRAAPDIGGNKPAIQANGSTRSYGERYTTKALLGIATKGQDDDGKTSQAPDAPAGFYDWWTTMEAVADEGLAKLEETWRKSKKDYTSYVRQHKVSDWSGLKRKADKVVPRA